MDAQAIDDKTLLGEVLDGTYRIDRFIGAGGMGAVFEATHLRLGNRCAVKLLTRWASSDPELVKRFEREAKVTAALVHPNIVEVTDYNVSERWGPYLVMVLLEGESLAARMGRMGRADFGEVDAIVSQVASALELAHERGIVHRDLKPANIFLCGEEGTGQVKVLDFGIAKLLGGATVVTRSGARLGTSYYMAPEQVRGCEVDRRTDQFALACIAFQLFAGRPPFSGDTESAVFYQIETKDPPALGDFAPEVSEETERVINRALRREPEQRFDSIVSFAGALSSSLGGNAQGDVTSAPQDMEGAAPAAMTTRREGRTRTDVVSGRTEPSAEASTRLSTLPGPGRRGPKRRRSAVLGLFAAAALSAVLLVAVRHGDRTADETASGGPSGDSVSESARRPRQGTNPESEAGDAALPGAATSDRGAKDADPESGEPASISVVPAPAEPLPVPARPTRRRALRRGTVHHRACRSSSPATCYKLGAQLGRAGQDDLAVAALLTACSARHWQGCYELGRVYLRQGDRLSAVFALKRGCEHDVFAACEALGSLYLAGLAGRPNIVRARKYLWRACQGRDPRGCFALGKMYCSGGQLPADAVVCRRHLRRACKLGSRPACRALRAPREAHDAR